MGTALEEKGLNFPTINNHELRPGAWNTGCPLTLSKLVGIKGKSFIRPILMASEKMLGLSRMNNFFKLIRGPRTDFF